MFSAVTNNDSCSFSLEQQIQQQHHCHRNQLDTRKQNCCNLDNECGEASAESETFVILGQFEKLYKNRLAEVETDANVSDAQVNELKLKIMKDWVDDLGEQNKMLVKTVHELEQAAISRVKLLENKLQETSTLMTHNMSHSDKSEEDLNALSSRTNILLHDQNDMQQKVDFLQSDVTNLLKLIKRGREENNWNLDGIKFYLLQPSDIPSPSNCSCSKITSESNVEDRALVKKLCKELRDSKAEINDLKDKHQYEVNNLLLKISEKEREIKQLVTRFAGYQQEKNFTGINQVPFSLTEELEQKKNLISKLKDTITNHEKMIEVLTENYRIKNIIICEIKNELKKKEKNLENTNIDQLQNTTAKQLEELKSLLVLKDNEISKLKQMLNTKPNKTVNKTNKNISFNVSSENENQVQLYSANTVDLISKDDILSLKIENENILEQLKNVESMHNIEIAIANEKLQDVKDTICHYKSNAIEQNKYKDNTKEFVAAIENKIVYIQNLFQNKCEMCAKENLISEIKEIISKVTSGICTLSKMYENKNKESFENKIAKNDIIYKKKYTPEQKAIIAAILQQFRMMEEFRVCTVEVQAATEDLREEMSVIISNLNTRHTKYLELTKMVSQVQDCLTRTRENISEAINRLELQDEERIRHGERITNNRIRLKDIKNEFNQTQSELSKCLNNVHNNIQQTNLLGYSEIHTCNNLLITLAEEMEQIVNNLYNFQTQGSCTLSTMTELKKQLLITEHSVKALKQKSDQILIENESAQKYFTERSKKLEKYECEVDNCHTRMQDVLESIIATRNQMNKFGCLQECEYSFQTTNETITLKDSLRRLHKECEELKLKKIQDILEDKKDEIESTWESRLIELQDEIKLLKTEIKYKQEANIFLRQIIESLEKELESLRIKAEDDRKCSSAEYLELKKKLFEFENCRRVQKDTENNLECLTNGEINTKKSQLLDCTNDDQPYDAAIHGLQGVRENMTQLVKACQGIIQTIKTGLQEVGNEFAILVSEGSPHTRNSVHSIETVIDILTEYMERMKSGSSEIEKIKTSLCSKNKLLENMDEIIKIQKDSILISQLEVENLHKTLRDKIEAQETTIFHYEQEKRQLNKQIELQVQTINHLKDAVVDAKRTIDQLNKKAASDKELESQILKVTNMKSKMNELANRKNTLKKQCSSIQCKYEEATEEIKRLKDRLEDSYKNKISEKDREINRLTIEINDIKNQLQVYKLDFDLIEEEMQKMGITKPSIQNFKTEMEARRSETKTLRCDIEDYKKTVEKFKHDNEYLKKELNDLKHKNNENYKEISLCLQKELNQKNEIVNRINTNSHILKVKEENQILKKNNDILIAQIDVIKEESKNDKYVIQKQLEDTKYQLLEIQQNYEKVLQELNKSRLGSQAIMNQEICNYESGDKKEHRKSGESEKKLNKDFEDSKEKFEKYESYERINQRQKDEIMLLKKRLNIANQQLKNCNVTREDMIRQNKLLEDNNNKSMAELEDIVVQLEDMQSSLANLKQQCDTKTKSLECLSDQLTRMKRDKVEGFKESKHVLELVRLWTKQQKHIISTLQEKLSEKQQQLLRISTEKKKLLIRMKRLMRENKILIKGLKFIGRQTSNKQIAGLESLSLRQIQSITLKDKDSPRNGFYSTHSNSKQSNAIYSHFKRECKEKPNCTENKIRIQGDYKLFSTLEYLTEKVPRTSQINESVQIEKKSHEDRSDYGYQTSSSK